MSEPSLDADVAIVGAGPTGLTLAVLLAQSGHRVAVIERWPEPYRLPRAVHFDDEVGRLFQSCGIGDEVRALSQPAEVYEWRNAEGLTLLRFGRVGAGPSGWPFSSMFSQPELEKVIEARAGELPSIEIRRGVTVEDVTQNDDKVLLGCDDGSTVAAAYAVACDGANSTVRSLLGVDNGDRGFRFDWLVVDVLLDHEREFDPINLQVCDPKRPTTAVSGGPGRRRWEFMCLPGESLEELGTEQRAWELLEPWDVRPDNAQLERHAVYTFGARVAQSWQQGRVFLAGDAAHLMPPFAGQGMCAGIRDAANLAWKLDAVLRERAGEDLLSTYELERRPSAEFAIDLSVDLGKVICVADEQEASERDEAMSADVTAAVSEVPAAPGLLEGIIAEGSTLAGEQALQARVEHRWFDEVHGAGWRLVTDSPAALDDAAVGWFEDFGGVVVNVGHSAPDLSAWFDRHEVRWALQRPDFALFGTAVDPQAAGELLVNLRSRLEGTT